MSAPSESELMKGVLDAGKKPDAAGFSKALNELRSKGYLTDKNIETIQGWIGLEFPSSIRYLARELLKGEESEDGDEKEREEKIPSWDARNICSSATQNDLTGDPMPHDLREVVSFLLPRGGKSECLTESDLRTLLRPKADWDQIYLFDPSKPEKERAIISTPVYRLPSSGIWILGTAPYLRMLKAYQLESFGKHPIGAKVHTRSGIYGEITELFLAKPLHYDDFKALIVNNTPLPPSPSACVCLFKPRIDDWSETFRANYPIEKCKWLIPTWNGFPVVLGNDYSKTLRWNYKAIEPPAATEISREPEYEGRPEYEEEEEKEISAVDEAKNIIDAYWDVVNKKMSLIGENGETAAETSKFPITAILRIADQNDPSILRRADPNDPPAHSISFDSMSMREESGRTDARNQLTNFLYDYDPQIVLFIKWPTTLPRFRVVHIESESKWMIRFGGLSRMIDPSRDYQIALESPFFTELGHEEELGGNIDVTIKTKNIINAYQDIINKKLSLIGQTGEFMADTSQFPIKSILILKIVNPNRQMELTPDSVDTPENRASTENKVFEFLLELQDMDNLKTELRIKWPARPPQMRSADGTLIKADHVKSDSEWFNPSAISNITWRQQYQIVITSPFVDKLEERSAQSEPDEIENELDVAVELEAKNIVNNYWDVINKRMLLIGRDNEFEISLDESPIKAFLKVRGVDDHHLSVTYRPEEANTAAKRGAMRASLIKFFRLVGGNVTETLLSVPVDTTAQSTINNIVGVNSASQWFNNDAEIHYGTLSIDIINPFKSEFPEDEESGNELEQKSSMEEELKAKNIIDSYWDVINKKMSLREDGWTERSLNEFPINAVLHIEDLSDNGEIIFGRSKVNTADKRETSKTELTNFFRSIEGRETVIKLIIELVDTIRDIDHIDSESPRFNGNANFDQNDHTLTIYNPFTFTSEFSEQKSSMEEELEERKELEAYDIIDSYWKVINEKMSLIREDGQIELSLNEFPIDAILHVGDSLNGSRSIAFRPNEVNTVNKRDTAKAELIAFFESIEWRVIVSRLSISSSNVLGDVNRVDSESPRFNRDATFVVNDYGVNISNPFIHVTTSGRGTRDEVEEEHSYISHLPPPPSFRTGRDFVKWMRHILGALSLQDYRSRNIITIVPDSAGIIRMRLQLGWSGDRTLAITPSTIDSELDNIEENELAGSLRTAELRIAASSLHDATPGPFVAKPWESGHVTDSGQLIMNWTASDLSDQSEDEGSDQSEDEE
jgi:hypothetical protein